MDEAKYCELEAKYDASTLPVSDFQAEMAAQGGSFKVVVGLDTFFSDTKKVLRYRRCRPGYAANPVDRQALTYKQRRRSGDISDRTEIDLWLGDKATEQDVRAMMEAMGMEEAFTITKESWIQHVTAPTGMPGGLYLGSSNVIESMVCTGTGVGADPNSIIWGPPYRTCPSYGPTEDAVKTVSASPDPHRIDAVFALYDVIHEGKIRRFLEVEMERGDAVSSEAATEKLEYWKKWINEKWPNIGQPLQTSLYEMFAPRNNLFVPESF